MALSPTLALRFAAGMVLLGLCWTPAAAATPEDGRRAYDAGHFSDALGIWAELSRAGNAEAEFGLGLLYDLGNGTAEDPETAFFWYKTAADAGLPEAEFNVAAMYDSGRGVAQSVDKAALWYARAAARGHLRAAYDLGLLYDQGEGVPHNSDVAAAWLRKAADGGLPAAASRLKLLQASAAARPAGQLVGVTLAVPTRNAALKLAEGKPAVELVWQAPAEPQPVHYDVQVLGGPNLKPVFSASVSTTAMVAHLPANADFYLWKVDTVGPNGAQAATDWSWFSTGPANGPHQSVASAPEAPRAAH
ncbi:tetratricopeptide repeat protein [Rhodopila sp.]|uniref:tetratricopeptide repeat protein n=1 Tax=Rhodopila sp. TaxID=2480087 RepID=UPI003D0ACC68